MPSKNSNYSSLMSYCRHVTMETVKRLERGLNYNYNSYFRRFHFRKWLTVLRSVRPILGNVYSVVVVNQQVHQFFVLLKLNKYSNGNCRR